jgi:hypothetical protein
MTVHAAKGLEFPVVFVVNLARGTANRRAPIRIATSGDEDGSVAVGDFQSSGDEDQADKEREETKRLLYVAMTRARDRLYLGTVLKEGLVQPGRGSLAEVLPASFLASFGAAAAGGGVLVWKATSGVSHAIRTCASAPPQAAAGAVRTTPAVPAESDFAHLDSAVPPRQTVAAMIAGPNLVEAGLQTRLSMTAADDSDRLVGSLVHRLLQREGLAADAARSDAWIAERLGSLVRVEESIAISDRDTLIRRAAAAYRAFSEHGELRALYLSGQPFTKSRSRSRSTIASCAARSTVSCRRLTATLPYSSSKLAGDVPSMRRKRRCTSRLRRRSFLDAELLHNFSTQPTQAFPELRSPVFGLNLHKTEFQEPCSSHKSAQLHITASLSALHLPDSAHRIKFWGETIDDERGDTRGADLSQLWERPELSREDAPDARRPCRGFAG